MKRSCLLATLLLPLGSFAQDIAVQVTGKIGRLNKPAVILLERGSLTDSIYPVNGKFSFSVKIDEPMKAWLGCRTPEDRVGNWTPIYLEKGKIQVKADGGTFSTATLKGTPLNEAHMVFTEMMKPVKAKGEALNAVYNRMKPGEQLDKSLQDSVMKERTALKAQERGLQERYITAHPDQQYSLFLLREFSGSRPDNIADVERLFAQLTPALQESDRGKTFISFIRNYKNTQIGAKAAAFTQQDTAGQNVSLEDFKGRYVLIDFWASWCMPCRAMNPELVKTYQRFKDRDFTILGVSLDRDKQAWIEAIHKDQLTWSHVSDLQFWKNEVAVLYGIKSVPQNFLIDQDGRIVARNIAGARLNNFLDSALKAGVAYTVKGRIEQMPAGRTPAKAYLTWIVPGDHRKDSVIIENGMFTFAGTIDTIREAKIELYDTWPIKFRTDSRKLIIGAGLTEIMIRDSVRTAIIKGIPANEEMNVYEGMMIAVDAVRGQLDEEYAAVPRAVMKQKGYYATHFRDRFNKNTREKYLLEAEFLRRFPDSYIAIRDLEGRTQSAKQIRDAAEKSKEVQELKAVYAQLSDNRKNSEQGRKIKAAIDGIGGTAVGSQFVPFTLPDINGKTVDVAAISRDKIVLIDFWGSWCHWCREGHPHLKELYSKYKDKGFEIVAVAVEYGELDKQLAAWKGAVEKDGVPWLHVLNDPKVIDLRQAYGVGSYPSKILVDRSGKIILRAGDDEERLLDKKLAELLP